MVVKKAFFLILWGWHRGGDNMCIKINISLKYAF